MSSTVGAARIVVVILALIITYIGLNGVVQLNLYLGRKPSQNRIAIVDTEDYLKCLHEGGELRVWGNCDEFYSLM